MPNRTICDVLDEMRTCLKTVNFSYLLSLIEEVQTMANRMERRLWDQYDTKELHKEIRELKDEKEDLRAEIKALTKQKGFIV